MTDRFLRVPDLEAIVGVSERTVRRLEAKGLFPKRVQITQRTIGWRESAVMAWLEEREAREAA
jgi:prophage regulatory protein